MPGFFGVASGRFWAARFAATVKRLRVSPGLRGHLCLKKSRLLDVRKVRQRQPFHEPPPRLPAWLDTAQFRRALQSAGLSQRTTGRPLALIRGQRNDTHPTGPRDQWHPDRDRQKFSLPDQPLSVEPRG